MMFDAIDTPALILDSDAMARNIARMAAEARDAGVALRPHAKTHKSPAVARHQVAAGAVGVCCQKVGEAEIMVEGGVADVLVTNEIVGASKLGRLAGLAKFASIRTVADHPAALDALAAACAAAGVEIGVLVECDLGMGRCGIADPSQAVALAKRALSARGVRFDGLQAYHGKIQHVAGWGQRRAAAEAANARLAEFRAAFAAAGIATPIVSGAGTGSYEFQTRAGYTEFQCGTYVFMDKQYRDVGDASGERYSRFEQALFVLATVMSVPSEDRVVLDAGLKSLSMDGGMPEAVDLPGWSFSFGGDEHGILRRTEARARQPRLGEKLRLVPGHGDTTINLHDEYRVLAGGAPAMVWPVAARGKIR
jgi:D-serine deaminase-like pyridoxal phosphate-dependent protein